MRCFNRVVVTPHSWFEKQRSEQEEHDARLVNFAAERAVIQLREQGWMFALFPAGTRARPGDDSSRQAIDETDSYLRLFDYLVLAHISGCTLPPSKRRDLAHETPRLDRMIYTFGPLQQTATLRGAAAARFPELDQRAACARAIMEDIEALAPQS